MNINKIIFVVIMFFISLLCCAQTINAKNGVELNLTIFQQYYSNKTLTCSSVGVSITNNTGKKIYIPDLRAYCIPFIYKKVAGAYSERQNVGGKMIEEYVNPYKNGTPPKRNDDFDPDYGIRVKEITNNISDIVNNQNQFSADRRKIQFELVRDSASFSSPEKLQIVKPYIVDNMKKIRYSAEYIGFLKPSEILESYYSISAIDKLKEKGDYKIFVDVVAIKKILETKRMFYPYPAEFYHDIMGYELFLPENMTFNVVYITIL
jgi:hypothetical protein